MVFQLVVGAIIILLVVFFFIPTIDVLSLSFAVPPTQRDISIIPTKITLYQQWGLTRPTLNASQGDVAVDIILTDSSNNEKFRETYYVYPAAWKLNTFQPISRGDVVTIVIESHDFTEVIPIE